MRLILGAAALGALVATSSAVAGGTTVYNNRVLFEAQLGSLVTDGYDSSVYGGGFNIYDNATMSAFLGETDYFTTGFSNWNFHLSNDRYCAGCNGSFRLTFTSTSVGDASGVYGAGLDIMAGTDYHAFVTFGDNSTADYALTGAGTFWGITSNLQIQSIHVGLANGGSTTGGYIEIDNLTIGSAVPAPGALALLAAAGLVSRRRRR